MRRRVPASRTVVRDRRNRKRLHRRPAWPPPSSSVAGQTRRAAGTVQSKIARCASRWSSGTTLRISGGGRGVLVGVDQGPERPRSSTARPQLRRGPDSEPRSDAASARSPRSGRQRRRLLAPRDDSPGVASMSTTSAAGRAAHQPPGCAARGRGVRWPARRFHARRGGTVNDAQPSCAVDSYHSGHALLLLRPLHGPDRRRIPAQAIPKCWDNHLALRVSGLHSEGTLAAAWTGLFNALSRTTPNRPANTQGSAGRQIRTVPGGPAHYRGSELYCNARWHL